MDIYVSIQNIVDDISSKFLQELGGVDPIPPRGTVLQSINESNARLLAVCSRYLTIDFQEFTDDDLTTSGIKVYHFALTSRKAANKQQALTDLIHSYLVNSALAKCYATVNQADLADKHDKQGISDAKVLSILLTTKLPPQ